ncbi:MAG: MFS transporter, partial [Solirubrobacteraceae bacterium]
MLSGLASSFAMLLLTRVALGAVTATAGPTVSSLISDFIPARERARIYGFILSGELLGAGFGFLVSGEAAAALSWPAAFLILAIPSLALAIAIPRLLPEPARGGESRLEPGASQFGAHRPRTDRPAPGRDGPR